jgi:pyrroline-5-carboxylate reductase
MKNTRVCFIGAGNMARSLIGGLVADGWDPASISVSDPDKGQLTSLTSRFPVHVEVDNRAAAAKAQVAVLAVKPQALRDVAKEISEAIKNQDILIISIAAGVRARDLRRWLGDNCALVRCMPNTPALVQSGATALFATDTVTDAQKSLAESIMRAVGLALWVDTEDLLDSVTALSGSGPAYFFLLIEALQDTGQELGLSRESANLLAVQTAFGAAKMALESSEDAGVLRRRVTSPGGTTEKALEVLEQGGLRALVGDALRAARERSRELADQLGAE